LWKATNHFGEGDDYDDIVEDYDHADARFLKLVFFVIEHVDVLGAASHLHEVHNLLWGNCRGAGAIEHHLVQGEGALRFPEAFLKEDLVNLGNAVFAHAL